MLLFYSLNLEVLKIADLLSNKSKYYIDLRMLLNL